MKIVKLKGGLGNQMFQYAFAKCIQKETGDEVRLDYSAFAKQLNDSIRKPRLMKFNVSLKPVSKEELKSALLFQHEGNTGSLKYKGFVFAEKTLNRKYYFEKDRGYREPKSIIKNKSYFDGYWQAWKNVDSVFDELKKDFVPNYALNEKTKEVLEKIRNENSVFVGVRKGDYATQAKHFGSFDISYYLKAMDEIEKTIDNPVYYVFSNEIDWVKQNMDFGNRNIVYRENSDIVDDFEEFILMTECKHSIIINSTYHWWGARLNYKEGKIVIAPKKWFFDDAPIDIVPNEWVRM